MKTYNGLVEIACGKQTGKCSRNLPGNVEPACMACSSAIIRILDLSGAGLFEFRFVEPCLSEETGMAGEPVDSPGGEHQQEEQTNN